MLYMLHVVHWSLLAVSAHIELSQSRSCNIREEVLPAGLHPQCRCQPETGFEGFDEHLGCRTAPSKWQAAGSAAPFEKAFSKS